MALAALLFIVGAVIFIFGVMVQPTFFIAMPGGVMIALALVFFAIPRHGREHH